MKIDITKFYELEKQKLLSVQKHPEVDLLIWNYTQKAQFDRVWTPETTMARGLITDLEGNILARPFSKFWNYEEHVGEGSTLPPIPMEDFEVFNKLDGSLGILYWTDRPQIATRGSFTSDQAIKANQMLTKYGSVWNRQYTYLFEILFPSNRIVVDYKGKEELVLLAVFETETGKEIDYDTIIRNYSDIVPVVERFDGLKNLEGIKGMMENTCDNAEGFVIRFKSGMRIKMKYAEYVRLHRLVTGVNAKTIWELLANKQSFDDLLERVPEEFYDWVKKTKSNLEAAFKEVESSAAFTFDEVKNLPSRKEQAMFIDRKGEFPSVTFAMLDKKNYDKIIWKLVKPRAEKPFKIDADAV